MKKYVRSRIIVSIEFMILFTVIFSLKELPLQKSSFLITMNTNLNKNVDKSIIQLSQNELYKKGIYNPIYTFIGNLNGYAKDCENCSGYLACSTKTNKIKNGIYYDDDTYGKVRIVAGSKKYSCGTIIRFNNDNSSSESIVAIVLDRGVSGNIIEMLTDNTNNENKKSKKVEFEVLREGWTR